MNKGKKPKTQQCYKSEKIKIEGSSKVLRNKIFKHPVKINEQKGSEEMTTGEVINLLEILKEKGYTLTEAVELFKRIANKK